MRPIVEVESGDLVASWAISVADATTPNEWWAEAQPDDDGIAPVLVRSDSPETRIGAPKGRVVKPESLVPELPADSFTRRWSMPELTVKAFGPALLEAVEQGSNGLIAGQSHGALTSVRYQDRYLRSPLTAGLLVSLMQALGRWGLTSATSIQVDTTFDQRTSSYENVVGSNFASTDVQREALRLLLQRSSTKLDVRVHRRIRDVTHARRLELAWANGQRVEILLDQGLGFVRTQRHVPFDRMQQIGKLANEIARLDVPIVANAVTYISGVRVSAAPAKGPVQEQAPRRSSTMPPPAE